MKKTFVFLTILFLNALAFGQTMPAGAEPVLWQKALRIHRSAIIVDGHNDIPTPMAEEDYGE